jgi:hypothetical protein
MEILGGDDHFQLIGPAHSGEECIRAFVPLGLESASPKNSCPTDSSVHDHVFQTAKT